MKTITIELSPRSCAKAVKELDKYQKDNKPKLDEICRRLAEIGAREAMAHLKHENGNDDATILPIEPIANGYKIVMQGADVYFVEFGTGSDVDAHYSDTSVPVFAGSWSMEHSQKYARDGVWWYGGEIYVGTPAYMPMYYAGKAIRDNIKRVAKEVLGK